MRDRINKIKEWIDDIKSKSIPKGKVALFSLYLRLDYIHHEVLRAKEEVQEKVDILNRLLDVARSEEWRAADFMNVLSGIEVDIHGIDEEEVTQAYYYSLEALAREGNSYLLILEGFDYQLKDLKESIYKLLHDEGS